MAKLVAVVGDPRSGKSVLTHLLYSELARRGVRTMFQEAELFSPTPPWYLEAWERETAEEIRRRLKAEYRKSEEIARRRLRFFTKVLEGLHRNPMLDVVVVDLGGGKPPAERVTPENEELLKHIDGVVVLCREDNFEECAKGWINEIKSKTPHVRILALCSTTLTGGESEVDLEHGRCHFVGLERGVALSPPMHLREAVSRLADHILRVLREE